MRRNKPNSHKKKNQNHNTRDVRDNYLPRTGSSLDILDNFDDIENVKRREKADQVRVLSDEDLAKGKKYKLHDNWLPEVKAASSLPSNESVLCDVCSLHGISEYKDSRFSSNSEDTECNITAADWDLYYSDMESFLPRNKRQISRSKRTETGALETEFKSRSLFDDKEQIHYSKDLLRTRINKDNQTTAASLPLLLQTPRQEKVGNLSENKKIFKGRKQRYKSYEPDIGTVNGKKLSNFIAPEYHNLRPFLPLLTLCQCPDYDSAVIEVVRDYNDPCRGVASLIYPTTNLC